MCGVNLPWDQTGVRCFQGCELSECCYSTSIDLSSTVTQSQHRSICDGDPHSPWTRVLSRIRSHGSNIATVTLSHSPDFLIYSHLPSSFLIFRFYVPRCVSRFSSILVHICCLLQRLTSAFLIQLRCGKAACSWR